MSEGGRKWFVLCVYIYMEVTWQQLAVWCFSFYKMPFIFFLERLKNSPTICRSWNFGVYCCWFFFLPWESVEIITFIVLSFFLAVCQNNCDHFGNASVTSVGAAHGGPWFQLTPSSCQLNVPQHWWMWYCSNSLWDQCCCWLARLLASLKNQTWILLGRGARERLEKTLKILLMCMTLYRFLLFYSGCIILKKGIWSEFVPPLPGTVIHPPRSFFS